MALSVDEINTVSNKGIDKTMINNVYDETPFFVKLKMDGGMKADGGIDMRWNIYSQKLGRANAVDPGTQLTFSNVSTRTAAVLTRVYYEVDTLITWHDRDRNYGKGQIVDLAVDKAKELSRDFMDRLSTDLFTTNTNGNGIQSLVTIVNATASYGGISPSDVTSWKSTELATVTMALSTATTSLKYQVERATFGKNKPTIHITTRDLAVTFESLMAGNVRYEDKAMANAGFNNTTLYDAPVVGDPYCTSGYWYGLDTKNMEWRSSPEFNMKVTPWKETDLIGYPNTLVKILTWAGNLVCKSRQTCFKYTALS